MENKIRIMVADDHALIREGLKQILELEDDMSVVAEAADGNEAIMLARSYRPDVVLMDINMPKMNGLQAIKEIKLEKLPCSVIVLTIHEDREYLFKTLQIGAEGYVLKDAEISVIIEAIRSVVSGKPYIQQNMTGELIREFNKVSMHDKVRYTDSRLTSRETEVLELIAEGLINKEIAGKLCISEKTVKNHVASIFRKLDVSDRTQAAIYAFKHNIKN